MRKQKKSSATKSATPQADVERKMGSKKQKKTSKKSNEISRPQRQHDLSLFKSSEKFISQASELVLQELKANGILLLKTAKFGKPHARLFLLKQDETAILEKPAITGLEQQQGSAASSEQREVTHHLDRIKTIILGQRVSELSHLVGEAFSKHTSDFCISLSFYCEGGDKKLDLLFSDSQQEEYKNWCAALHYLVIDRKRASIHGSKLQGAGAGIILNAVAGIPASFSIVSRDAVGRAPNPSVSCKWKARLRGPLIEGEEAHAKSIDVDIVQHTGNDSEFMEDGDEEGEDAKKEEGNVTAAFTVYESGSYELHLFLAVDNHAQQLEEEFLGSPFTVQVAPNKINLLKTLVIGDGALHAEAGIENEFITVMRDSFGNKVPLATYQDISVILKHIQGEPESVSLEPEVREDGCVYTRYCLTKSGSYTIEVRYKGILIPRNSALIVRPHSEAASARVVSDTQESTLARSCECRVLLQLYDTYDNKMEISCASIIVEKVEGRLDAEYGLTAVEDEQEIDIKFRSKQFKRLKNKIAACSSGQYSITLYPLWSCSLSKLCISLNGKPLEFTSGLPSFLCDRFTSVEQEMDELKMQKLLYSRKQERKQKEREEQRKIMLEKEISEGIKQWTRTCTTFYSLLNEVFRRYSNNSAEQSTPSENVFTNVVNAFSSHQEILKAHKKAMFLIHPDRHGLEISAEKAVELNVVFHELQMGFELYSKHRS